MFLRSFLRVLPKTSSARCSGFLQTTNKQFFSTSLERNKQVQFIESKLVPGLLCCDSFLSEKEEVNLENFMKQTKSGKPENFGKGVYCSLVLPEDDEWYESLESNLLTLFNRCTVLNQFPAIGVVLLKYDADGCLPPHMDDPNKYGPVVVTIGIGSPAVLQMQLHSEQEKRTERVLLAKGSCYAMTGPARYQWHHGIEPGSEIVIDGQHFQRATRYALLFTPPLQKYSGPVLLRHPKLSRGCFLAHYQSGVLVLSDTEYATIDQTVQMIDRGQLDM